MSKRLTADVESLQRQVDELLKRVEALEAARKPGRPAKADKVSEAS